MEYKPPFERHQPRNKYIYCSLDVNDTWKCVRCEEQNKCHSSIPLCQSQSSRLFHISNDVPEYFDRLILMCKLNTINVEIQK
jgi:hypothetical protein